VKRSFFSFCFLSLLLTGFVFLGVGCYSPPVQPEGEPLSPVHEEEKVEEEAELTPDYIPPELDLLPQGTNLPVSQFREIWAYLVAGQEQALNVNSPITDLVYFGAEVDAYGKLVEVPNFKNIEAFRGRKHFVAACNGRALTHFSIMEGSSERKNLIRDLLEAAKPYDGLQIDFENVPARDGGTFLSFLGELRSGLGNKIFSIALPARIRSLPDDVYSYAKIKPIVDRILVMAYDEHWSNSQPGPIASMGWCQRVARYSLDTVGTEKLIMGLPFYGRSWGNINANRAFFYSGIERIIREQNIKDINRENGIPNFKYSTTLSVTVYYEDAYSLSSRLEMYKKMDVGAVGFWRLGYETRAFWSVIALEKS
jgi:spore germination protein YaaH